MSTSRFGLTYPALTDKYSLDVVNANMRAIDEKAAINPQKISLPEASWDYINLIGSLGLASSYFEVGDEKDVALSTGEVVTVEIADFDHDVLSSDGTTRTAMTFVLKNCMNDKAYMNPTNTNVGGWASCALRTTLQGTIYNTLPEALRSVIKTVRKFSGEGGQSVNVGVTADTLFLFSEIELSGASRYSIDGEGSRYAVFSTNESRVKNVDGVPTGWFTRSAIEELDTAFVIASSQGNMSNTPNYYARGVCFGFCV